mmetsp:Transcript_12952/g.58448  ORF Transcript_12952/g.58448 Transcript_12952/m.58448 type:complete len:232 (+) Transcript_12952:291-986(+)
MLLMKQCSWCSSFALSCCSAALSAARPLFSFSRVALVFCNVSSVADSFASSSRSLLITTAASVTIVALSVLRGPAPLGSSSALSPMNLSFSASLRNFSRRDFLFFADSRPPSSRPLFSFDPGAHAAPLPSASKAAMVSCGRDISDISRDVITPSSAASKMSASQSPESSRSSLTISVAFCSGLAAIVGRLRREIKLQTLVFLTAKERGALLFAPRNSHFPRRRVAHGEILL